LDQRVGAENIALSYALAGGELRDHIILPASLGAHRLHTAIHFLVGKRMLWKFHDLEDLVSGTSVLTDRKHLLDARVGLRVFWPCPAIHLSLCKGGNVLWISCDSEGMNAGL
jgi:hypothetical protein